MDSEEHGRRTFDITTPFMYISGADEQYFTGKKGPLEEAYSVFQENPEARDIRSLCMIRTAVMADPGPVSFGLMKGGRRLSEMSNLVPPDALEWLSGRGIRTDVPGRGVPEHVAFLDSVIESRIDDARYIFPEWVEWRYIRNLLLLPGDRDRTAGPAMTAFENGRRDYPYGVWVSWDGRPERMMLKDDATFLGAVYGAHGEEPPDMDPGAIDRADAEASLKAFIAGHGKTLVAADGENNDPVMLISMLRASKGAAGVAVVDSGNGSAAWEMLSCCGLADECGAEHFTVPATSGYKNQADMALTVYVSRKVFTEGYDSVVLASSDCDFMALIGSFEEVDFLVVADRDKCGVAMKKSLKDSFKKFCWINGFDGDDGRRLKVLAANRRMEDALSGLGGVDLLRMLRSEEKRLRIELPAEDEAEVLRGIAERLKVSIDGEWKAHLALLPEPDADGKAGLRANGVL